jgi:hypothetical protein
LLGEHARRALAELAEAERTKPHPVPPALFQAPPDPDDHDSQETTCTRASEQLHEAAAKLALLAGDSELPIDAELDHLLAQIHPDRRTP